MSNQVLERFHRALIEEIQTQRPEYLTGPFTVAEIYQNLVPYGSHRDRIGVEMNGDYEDALLRLLAGEGGYLVLDSDPALQALKAEVQSSNPNTGLYREFAAVDVRLNQAYLDLSASAMDQLPDLVRELEAEDPIAMTDLAPSAGPSADLGIVPPGVDIFSEAELYSDPEPEPDVAHESPVGVETNAPPESYRGYRGDAEAEAMTDEVAPSDDGEASQPSGRPPLAPEFVEPEPMEAVAAPVDGQCRWCGEGLPDREPLNFCPFCGTDQNLVPCTSCGSEIEPGWSFCASCGASTDG